MKISFAEPALPAKGAVVVLVEEGRKLSPAAKDLDKQTKGAVMRAIKASKFVGKEGQSLEIMAPAGGGLDRVLLAGTGKKFGALEQQALGGNIVGKLKNTGSAEVTVIGLMKALAGRKAKVNVVGLVGLVENMPDGKAQRPGDIVKSMSGQTIEILNTDAEGRLVLADVLWYCQDRFKPEFIVDLATLTGAIVVGLGHEYAGLFSNDDKLADRLFAAGTDTGEKVWRMPLHDNYDKLLKSAAADMQNIGGKGAGSITAAQFLLRFVNKTPWAHLDIAGMAWSKESKPTAPKGATGFGVRLLDRFIADNYE